MHKPYIHTCNGLRGGKKSTRKISKFSITARVELQMPTLRSGKVRFMEENASTLFMQGYTVLMA